MNELIWIGNTLYPRCVIPAALVAASLTMFGVSYGLQMLIRRLYPRPGFPPLGKFKPQVIYNEEIRLTEMILEDTSIVWCPWGPFKGHAVDCGYSPDGRLVGIQIWDDVRRRPSTPKP